MSRTFTSIILAWTIDTDSEKIDSIFSIGNSLELLALSPAEKKERIPDCLFCELYFSFVSAYKEILNPEVLIHAPFDFQSSLSKISQQLENLHESEAQCWNRDIVDGNGWTNIRSVSIQALTQMEWNILSSYQTSIYTKVDDRND
jgi:hypothetical protein